MDEKGTTVQICPDSAELSEIKTNICCSEEGCTSIFSNSGNLEMHLIKTHNKKSCYLEKKGQNINFQYFCPEKFCKYGLSKDKKSSELRWFSKYKYLKQHYLKVHKEKGFKCKTCEKPFLSEKDIKNHQLFECGRTFCCNTCPSMYNSYVSLTTHCRRKNHSFIKMNCRPEKMAKTSLANGLIVQVPVKERPILPKSNLDSSVNIAAAALSELSRKVVVKGVDKAVQTLVKKRTPVKAVKKRDSRQTQTGDKQPRISAETQTTTLYANKKPSRARRRKKSMQTQTTANKPVDPDQTSFMISDFGSPLDDVMLPEFWSERNSSGTQTNSDLVQIVLGTGKELNLDIFAENSSAFSQLVKNPCETIDVSNSNDLATLSQVEDDLQMYSNEQIDRLIQQTTIFDETRSCNIETQTEIDFSDLIDDCPIFSNTETQTIQNAIDVYSNNYTQTCDDFLKEFVEFSDIETQTAWANLNMESDLVSAETQTAL